MTYELAKQLKDAGYPQETEFYFAPKLTRFNGANDHNCESVIIYQKGMKRFYKIIN